MLSSGTIESQADATTPWEAADRADHVGQGWPRQDIVAGGFDSQADIIDQGQNGTYSHPLEPSDSEKRGPQIKIDNVPSSPAEELYRPPSATSTDTFRQASTAFLDFDGVHYTADDVSSEAIPKLAGHSSTENSALEAIRDPRLQPHGSDAVFYPAPVPTSLNLPRRLSRLPPPSSCDDRRSSASPMLPYAMRRQTTGLVPSSRDGATEGPPNQLEPPVLANPAQFRHSVNDLTRAPPQLRASTFFEHPPTQQAIVIKGNSAVQTLDSILDASMDAPVGAFSAHPIADPVGGERTSILDNDRRVSRISLGSRVGLRSDVEQRAGFSPVGEGRTEYPSAQVGLSTDDNFGGPSSAQMRPSGGSNPNVDESHDITAGNDWVAHSAQPRHQNQPTTLLAELQLRKEQLRQRTTVAATAYPNGMRSTLLELDSVAEVQQRSRMNKRTTLAWEDPRQDDKARDERSDEEVPLALLYPNSRNRVSEVTRPLGLLEKRDLEDNEPLSRRRDRLRNSQAMARGSSRSRGTDAPYRLEVPGLVEWDQARLSDGDDNEPLAQRARKMKARAEGADNSLRRPVSKDFAAELMSQFAAAGAGDQDVGGHASGEDETLAQRKQRLQAGQLALPQQRPKYDVGHDMRRRTMADILQAHPVPSHPDDLKPTARHSTVFDGFSRTHRFAAPYGLGPHANSNGAAVMGLHPAATVSMPCGLNTGNFSTFAAPHQPPGLDPSQRDKIDQWRCSIIP